MIANTQSVLALALTIQKEPLHPEMHLMDYIC